MKSNALSNQYIKLLKKSLVNELYIENELRIVHTFRSMLTQQPLQFRNFFDIKNVEAPVLKHLYNSKETGDVLILGGRSDLRNYTELSHSMIGKKRLDNLQFAIETVLSEDVEGDFIETGIWRGGACIFMRGVLKAYGITNRTIWAADSFEGVPAPSLPQDANFDISRNTLPILVVPIEEVKELFQRYDLLDNQTKFLPGWFKDTLHVAPIEKLAILRLDGDLYESTMDALIPLYDKVSLGGFVIVDDYGSCPPCKQAIHDFRDQRGITDPITTIDSQSVYWRKF